MLLNQRYLISFSPRLLDKFFYSASALKKRLSTVPNETVVKENAQKSMPEFENFRHVYQDFLPTPIVRFRNPITEKLERRDMLRRRSAINIPEFYVGTIMAVTSSNEHANEKMTKFVGICIWKYFQGLRSKFILRNVVENIGVEVLYSLYSPLIQKIEVLKLEKRLDEELFYLRDAPNEYSEIPFDFQPVYRDETLPVPINTTKVKINPRPWLQRYERMNLKGVELPELPEKFYIRAKELAEPWKEYDMMDEYRKTTPEEDQKDIFLEVCESLKALSSKQNIDKRKKSIELQSKSTKQLF